MRSTVTQVLAIFHKDMLPSFEAPGQSLLGFSSHAPSGAHCYLLHQPPTTTSPLPPVDLTCPVWPTRTARTTQVSWLSWWAQTILSTVAFIILLFSNAVTDRSARGNILGNGVALALGSLACSAASVCW